MCQQGLTTGMGGLTASGQEDTPLQKPSWSSPLTLPIEPVDIRAGSPQDKQFIYYTFNPLHGVLKARILNWFAILFSVDHVLLELSTMTYPSWVALHNMAHSFIELDKAVVHVIKLVSFL